MDRDRKEETETEKTDSLTNSHSKFVKSMIQVWSLL